MTATRVFLEKWATLAINSRAPKPAPVNSTEHVQAPPANPVNYTEPALTPPVGSTAPTSMSVLSGSTKCLSALFIATMQLLTRFLKDKVQDSPGFGITSGQIV
mmetsp:Transcript_32920/g.69291  ORF Transcript_32920/g.69291 Transcript_32920/m.69291 type:complete len:103 (+) Transcript_32920:205-513(+)|eukprot:CAMPEP_0172312972 /NCGR_PEP_ID=MMETSP1058-20130122/18967_1 /TAXON_ID=83371 /ORGANISM="Detonula confervacea, Strain CCMP 353" /LENGTH=102 /DNA_ID=CAMNT_0013026541 /DNA_START=143 /DNA_END=451 /DNA_ORIENTATION=-